MLTPIPTEYAGTRFRSRTEARWAAIFDQLGIQWRYEDEGYQLRSGWYLPDFWLPVWRAFAEVKGGTELWDRVAITKARELATAAAVPVLMLDEIHVLAWCVRGMGADGEEYPVDILHSIEKGRVWWDDLAASNAYYGDYADLPPPTPDQWMRVCEHVQRMRFGYGRTARA